MKKLLVSLLLSLISVTAAADPLDRIKGLGKDRENLTPELLEARVEALLDALEFWIMRNPAMQFAPDRIFEPQMWQLIKSSAAAEGLDPMDLAALVGIESQGRPYAKSPTGPVGICQCSKAVSKQLGLLQTEKRLVTRQVWRGKGAKKKKVTVKARIEYVVHDRRLDVNYAIPACAKWLAAGKRIYGSVQFAIQRHHNGDGRVMKILSLYTKQQVTYTNAAEIVGKFGLTMPKVYFDNTPYHRGQLYEYLEKIRKEADSAPNYYLRVLKYRRLLEEYLSDPAIYAAKYRYYQTQFKDDGVAPSRMWYFYTLEQVERLQFTNLATVEEATEVGRLVSLPKPWRLFGYTPRLSGKSPIGEKDLRNQDKYLCAEAGTIGALLYIMNEVKLLQSRNFVPYEVNSLVRTVAYQGVLQASNGNARTLLPTHTIGKAFDLPMKGISSQRRRDILFILSDMDAYGMISYIPEGAQDTIHVVPHPQWEQYFERYYRNRVASTIATATQNSQK